MTGQCKTNIVVCLACKLSVAVCDINSDISKTGTVCGNFCFFRSYDQFGAFVAVGFYLFDSKCIGNFIVIFIICFRA